jgi:hypothetical protein
METPLPATLSRTVSSHAIENQEEVFSALLCPRLPFLPAQSWRLSRFLALDHLQSDALGLDVLSAGHLESEVERCVSSHALTPLFKTISQT